MRERAGSWERGFPFVSACLPCTFPKPKCRKGVQESSEVFAERTGVSAPEKTKVTKSRVLTALEIFRTREALGVAPQPCPCALFHTQAPVIIHPIRTVQHLLPTLRSAD